MAFINLSPAFSALLRCPVTGQGLALATVEELGQLNTCMEQPMEAALIREDRFMAYPVHRGIPALLPSDGIVMASL